MKRVHQAGNLQEAHLLLNLLRHEGVSARLLNENAQGGLGEIPFTQAYPEIWLDDDRDEERAREVIARFERPPAMRTLYCSRCGESNPGSFDFCWNCQAPLG